MVRPEEFESPTFWFVAKRSDPDELRAQTFTSILQDGPRGSIRTSDPLIPNQVRYLAALHTGKTLVAKVGI
jgi:hypothetical protein